MDFYKKKLSDFKFDFRFGKNRIFREDSMILTFHVAPLARAPRGQGLSVIDRVWLGVPQKI